MSPHSAKRARSESTSSPSSRTSGGPRSTDVLKDALTVLGADVPGTKDSATSRALDVKTAWQLGVDLPQIGRSVEAKRPITPEAIDVAIRSRVSQLPSLRHRS